MMLENSFPCNFKLSDTKLFLKEIIMQLDVKTDLEALKNIFKCNIKIYDAKKNDFRNN